MACHGRLFLVYFLYFAIVLGEEHECDRQCLDNQPPKRCYFKFAIGVFKRKNDKSFHESSVFLSINGQSPGPIISVCQNDTIVVDVKNQLPGGFETSFHWHGLSDGNSPFMDGVPMITQCPIIPHTTFRYQLKAIKPGTFYYHAHAVTQQLDGLYGALIVNSKKEQKHQSQVVLVSPQLQQLQLADSDFELNLNVTGFRLNVLPVNSGANDEEITRVRIINAAALNCPVRIFAHLVPLKVVAVDGNEVESSNVPEINLYPGERIDLAMNLEVMKVTHIVGHNLCKGHAKFGLNSGFSKPTITKKDYKLPSADEFYQKLRSKIEKKLEKSEIKIFLSFDAFVYEKFKGSVDFRYKLGAFTPYAPSLLSKSSVSIIQINKKSFLYPSSPLLSQPEDVAEDTKCDLQQPSDRCLLYDNGFCECLTILNLPFKKKLDLIIIDEGKNSNTSQIIHLHGNSFYVLSMKSFNQPITQKQVENFEVKGQINRNLVNPVQKDTIAVPNKGYVVLRLETKNPGKWLLESSTSKAKTGLGLELVLNIKEPTQDLQLPKNFPTCRTTKNPDMVFNQD